MYENLMLSGGIEGLTPSAGMFSPEQFATMQPPAFPDLLGMLQKASSEQIANFSNYLGGLMPFDTTVGPILQSAPTGMETFKAPEMTIQTPEEELRYLRLGEADTTAVSPEKEMEDKMNIGDPSVTAPEKNPAEAALMAKILGGGSGGGGLGQQMGYPAAVSGGMQPVQMQRAVEFLKQSGNALPNLGQLLMGR